MESLARVGLFSRGIVYFLIGILALLMAVGDSHGEATDMRGVLVAILQQPLGTYLLAIVALGMFSYAIWRAMQSITDSDNLGSDWKGYGMRFGRMLSALAHVTFGAYAFGLVFQFKAHGGPQGERQLTRMLLKLPLGGWIVASVGIGVLVFGISQFVIAYREQFCDYISIPRRGSRTLKSICKFGLMARGFVFLIIGSFFVQAAVKHRSREAGGLKEAWAALQAQPYGQVLMGVVASGLIAYAFFTLVEASYRKQT